MGGTLKQRVLSRLGLSPEPEKPARAAALELGTYEANGCGGHHSSALHVAEDTADPLSPLSPRLQRLLDDAAPYLERLTLIVSTRLKRSPKTVRRWAPLVVGTALMLCICGARARSASLKQPHGVRGAQGWRG